MFETHVLAALSGEVASFPFSTSEFNGKEFNNLRKVTGLIILGERETQKSS